MTQKRSKYSKATKARALSMIAMGTEPKKIEETTKVPVKTIYNWASKMRRANGESKNGKPELSLSDTVKAQISLAEQDLLTAQTKLDVLRSLGA